MHSVFLQLQDWKNMIHSILSQDCCRLCFTYVLTMVVFFTIILVCHIPHTFKMLTNLLQLFICNHFPTTETLQNMDMIMERRYRHLVFRFEL